MQAHRSKFKRRGSRPGAAFYLALLVLGSVRCARIAGLEPHSLLSDGASAGAAAATGGMSGEMESTGTDAGSAPQVNGPGLGGKGNAGHGNAGNGNAGHGNAGNGNAGHSNAGNGDALNGNDGAGGSSGGDTDGGRPNATSHAGSPGALGRSCGNGVDGAGKNCGPQKDQDCCASYEVDGGGKSECPGGPSTLQAFRLDRYEVTIGRFREFMKARDWRPPSSAGTHPDGANSSSADRGWDPAWDAAFPSGASGDTWDDQFVRCGIPSWLEPNSSEREWLPASCVTWFQAQAFCIWDGGYLPSWLELSYAARGGDEDRPYPWGSAMIDARHAVCEPWSDDYQSPVGSVPAGDGRWNQSDLAGNVWEWTSYNARNGDGECVPCACNSLNVDFLHARAFGGSSNAQPFELGSTYVSSGQGAGQSGGSIPLKLRTDDDWYQLPDVGFRCARPLER